MDPVDKGNGTFDITCWSGEKTSNYYQEVTHFYRLAPEEAVGYTNPTRSFAFETPENFGHDHCNQEDPWGIIWTNEHRAAGHLGACIQAPLQSASAYEASDPGDWLYDISDYGCGPQPRF